MSKSEELSTGLDDGLQDVSLRLVLDAMPQMVWSTRADGYTDFYNARWYEFTGAPPVETQGHAWKDVFHPDDQARAWTRWRHSVETGEPYEIEYRLRRADGRYAWVLGRGSPLRDEAGEITRWIGTCTDINDLKEAEEQRDLVALELEHRMLNVFAVINSMLAMSVRAYPEAGDFVSAAQRRLTSLARAHDYVRPSHFNRRSPPTLRGLIEELLKPYPGAELSVGGPDQVIGSSTATSLALVLHELATNAVKHGGLSSREGSIHVAIRDAGDLLELNWTERGGPAVAGPPAHTGFGTTLSERALRGTLGGAITSNWDPEGLSVLIRLPKARLAR